MTHSDLAAHAAREAEPVIFLIDGSGLGVSLLIAFLALAAYVIGREATQ
jgi:hypothetical protein